LTEPVMRVSRSDRALDVAPVLRLAVGAVVGVAAGVLPPWPGAMSALLGGWAAGAAVFLGWTWLAVGTMDATETRAHATREEPTRPGAEIVLVVAALLSLVGVAGVLVGGQAHEGAPMAATLVGVVASWLAIHTVYALRYARLYYSDTPGGIDFHQDEPPRYTDFAYVAFTVGMSYAISDTDLASSQMRRHALRHALLAYLFGTVIIALVINVTAGAS